LTQDELRTTIQVDNPSELTYLAVHVRRGDRKPASFTFLNNKIPLSLYMNGVKDAWARLHTGPESKTNPVVYFASDSPIAELQFSKLYDGPISHSLQQRNLGYERLQVLENIIKIPSTSWTSRIVLWLQGV